MATGTLELIVDTREGRLVSSITSTKAAPVPRFTAGDVVPISVRIVEPTTDPELPWIESTLTSKTVKVSVGNSGTALTAGTFTVTYGGDTTSALAYNISAATFSTAINALASITSAGGVTVTSTGSAFRIAFVSNGTRTAITATVTGITPAAEATVTTITAGGASAKGIYVLRVKALPAASVTLTDSTPPTVTVTSIQTGDTGLTSEIQTIDVDELIYGGTYTLTLGSESVNLLYNLIPSSLQAAICALSGVGAGMATVSGVYPNYAVTFDNSLGTVATMTVDAANLVYPLNKTGSLNCADIAFIDLLAGASSASATLEVEINTTATGNKWTPLITPCTILADI